MKKLRAVLLASALVLGSVGVSAAAAAAARPLTKAELRSELDRVNRASRSHTEDLRREIQTTRTTVLVVMLGLAALIIFVYAKVGVAERNLLKNK